MRAINIDFQATDDTAKYLVGLKRKMWTELCSFLDTNQRTPHLKNTKFKRKKSKKGMDS